MAARQSMPPLQRWLDLDAAFYRPPRMALTPDVMPMPAPGFRLNGSVQQSLTAVSCWEWVDARLGLVRHMTRHIGLGWLRCPPRSKKRAS